MKELSEGGTTKMKVFGNSMLPIIKSGSKLTFEAKESYEKGDIVFCKVKGRIIDAHKITKIDKNKGYMIANNHGYENGWTKTIYGKVVEISPPK
jgi:SOS-response transcriptional repressor LexA